MLLEYIDGHILGVSFRYGAQEDADDIGTQLQVQEHHGLHEKDLCLKWDQIVPERVAALHDAGTGVQCGSSILG